MTAGSSNCMTSLVEAVVALLTITEAYRDLRSQHEIIMAPRETTTNTDEPQLMRADRTDLVHGRE
ncbi:hypothetical protein RvY_05588 [Ramazzottius varieornatus]|uniref:Uncharacterized protein n=1 Tax=Ramazzottius varieornatus TaxID=947166 RepID=A0A1D1UYL3_RAMVA|nr:hypothetical protein RvY_05588 [Ramazzottius varieornatus]